METYNRVCIKDYEIAEGDAVLSLRRGKEYLTSREELGQVTVFTNYWGKVPVSIFAGEVKFT